MPWTSPPTKQRSSASGAITAGTSARSITGGRALGGSHPRPHVGVPGVTKPGTICRSQSVMSSFRRSRISAVDPGHRRRQHPLPARQSSRGIARRSRYRCKTTPCATQAGGTSASPMATRLYDETKDPNEWTNLATKRIRRKKTELAKFLPKTDAPDDAPAGAERRRAKKTKRVAARIFAPRQGTTRPPARKPAPAGKPSRLVAENAERGPSRAVRPVRTSIRSLRLAGVHHPAHDLARIGTDQSGKMMG